MRKDEQNNSAEKAEKEVTLRTHIGCILCKDGQILEKFTVVDIRFPIPLSEMRVGPSIGNGSRHSRTQFLSSYFCENCGAAYVATQKNYLAKNHGDREKKAKEKLGIS